jgi:hypothetical protein
MVCLSTLPNVERWTQLLYAMIQQATGGKEDTLITEQGCKIRYQAIPECVQGLYYNSEIYS